MKRSAFLLPVLSCASLIALAAIAASCSAASDEDGDTSGGAGTPGGGGVGGGFTPGNGGTFGGENCGSSTFGNAVPGSMLVVLDRSGSMSGGDGQPDKWAPTKSALNAMMGSADPALQMGLLPFPAGHFDSSGIIACGANPSTPECAAIFADGGCMDVDPAPVVAVGPLSVTQGPISSWLSSNGPSGNTPTLHALKTGYQILRDLDALGERFVLLLTDGEPNVHTPAQVVGPFTIPESNIECKQLADIEAEALAASSGSPPVKTFVIGSPGSEGASDFLSRLAINGLTRRSPTCTADAGDCHYQIGTSNFQQELEAALQQIAGAVSDCVFEIPQGNDEVDPDQVNVAVETSGGTIETYKDPSHTDGWDYTDGSQTKIQLYGPACEAYKAEKGAKVIIVLGCKTVVK